MAEALNETPKDYGQGEAGEVRRWFTELQLADERDKDYKKRAKETYDRYRGKGRKKNSFNILWSNTETIAPAIYNSTPKPDVRRRFKDADPVGKTVSELLRRALEFSVDTEEFSHNITLDVLDMLIPSRGLSRVRYIPSLSQVPLEANETEDSYEGDHEAEEGYTEELAWEQTVIEHVNWEDFKHSAGRTWNEVTWIAFDHRLTKEECIERFGEEVASKIVYDNAKTSEKDNKSDNDTEAFKTAIVTEIWCKDSKMVYFVNKTLRDRFVKKVQDPLGLENFWPIPRPLYAINDSDKLEPTILFDQYIEQADELDLISTRINKIVNALKLRGIYDSTMSELSELMKGNDNQMIPVQNVAAMIDRGGLDKVIWFMPIEQAANVLKVLYEQRDACKQTIYEITGLGDIIRGQSNPNETLGAQKLKSDWGSQRISSMQREVQRYIRDLIRIMAEIIAEKFQPETLLAMTGLQIPTEAQVQQQYQQAMMQYQQVAAQAQQTGQQPPPPPPQPQVVTLEQVMQVLRDDAQRSFKIDVETDSTIQASIQDDVEGLTQVLSGVTQFMEASMPLVQSGMLPLEAAKEIVMTICRRSKMGNAVEDSLDQMQAPQQQQDPKAGDAQAKAQASVQAAQIKAQADGQAHQRKMDIEKERMTIEAHFREMEQRNQAMIEQHRNEMEAQRQQMQLNHEHALEQQRIQADAQTKLILAHLDRVTKLEVAEISAKTTLDSAQISAANQGASDA